MSYSPPLVSVTSITGLQRGRRCVLCLRPFYGQWWWAPHSVLRQRLTRVLDIHVMRCFFSLTLICFFGSVIAKDLEIVPYENVYKCPVASVRVIGTRCMNDNTCPTISPTQSEKAELITQSRKRFPIPPLVQSFPKSVRILRDEGSEDSPQPRIYGIDKVTCLGKNRIGVIYSGGGNCKLGCENYVTYTIRQDKGITNALLAE